MLELAASAGFAAAFALEVVAVAAGAGALAKIAAVAAG
jgi:hypothetical protein